MLAPQRTKWRKPAKARKAKGKASRGNRVSFGDYGLQALGHTRLTARQIEAARIAMTRFIKRGGKVWIRVFPHRAYTKKPAEVRMGKGKGSIEGYIAVVKPGHMLYEMAGVNEETAREAFRLAAHKLPVRTKFKTREGLNK